MLTKEDINYINRLSYKAGKAIMKVYNSPFQVKSKVDNSPITIADKRSHEIIENGLKKRFPDIPILSEEGENISYSERKKWKTFWLIDPLDGTKEFIKKNGEFTTNIALINNRFPIHGSVYAPFKNILYWAYKGSGAWKIEAKKEYQIKTNLNKDKIRIVVSRSHLNDKVLNFIKKYDRYELIRMGSSLKICCIAEGKADIYPRLGPTSEWDIGAAQCIIEEAGGSIIDYGSDDRLSYNKKNILNPFFIVKC